MNSTVKRKFNALLQGIGSRSSSSVSTSNLDSSSATTATTSTTHLHHHHNTAYDGSSTELGSPSSPTAAMLADPEFLSKRRRVGTLSSSSPGTKTTISNITLRKFTPNGSVVSTATSSAAAKASGEREREQQGPPKYCPGDREQLVRRLATFQELTDWTPKPERVSEVEWAKRGWVCQGKERVRCILCRKELVVKLNRKEVDGREVSVLVASEIADALVDKYAELMVASHQEDCLWRKKGCDDSLLRLPLPTAKEALSSLRQRYDELLVRRDFLPYELNLRLPDTLDIDTVLSYLPPDFFTNPPPNNQNTPSSNTSPSEPHRPALVLALLGWQGLTTSRNQPVPNSASCHTCLRRLGLWMFRSKEVDPATGAVLVPAAMDHLDPLREHRFFCPWRSGSAQRNPGAKPLAPGECDKAAWEVLVQALRNESFVRTRTSSTPSHGRSKSAAAVVPKSAPATPNNRPATAMAHGRGGEAEYDDNDGNDLDGSGGTMAAEDEMVAVRKKDQALLARLRRVKSLFNTNKAGSKLKRMSQLSTASSATHSRPGTAGGGE